MIYVRTISIYRPTPPQAGGVLQVGKVDYQGLSPAVETALFSGIPCSIQAEALGNAKLGGVPSDSPGPVKWTIYVPRTALQLGDVKDRDVIVDDLGERYQVAAAYHNILGYKLGCIRTEA